MYMIQLCNNAHNDMYKFIKTRSDTSCWSEKLFWAPDQIGKTKTSGSVVPGSFKIFQNTFESLGFIHVDHTSKQQANQSH